MSYLLDSDWVIDLLGGKPDALELLARLADDDVSISLMSYGEVYEGIYRGRDREATEAVFLDFLASVDILELDKSIMRRYARISGDLRRKGQHIGVADILIAATALEHKLTLVTRNLAHFSRIPHLRIYADA